MPAEFTISFRKRLNLRTLLFLDTMGSVEVSNCGHNVLLKVYLDAWELAKDRRALVETIDGLRALISDPPVSQASGMKKRDLDILSSLDSVVLHDIIV